ncbi:VanZ family protein [Butyricicoccus sp.]|uniref:VanZ family protein n=1 Tax=Butyricicoccus sp. TaxID=2049021 RepID=UPI003F15BF5D
MKREKSRNKWLMIAVAIAYVAVVIVIKLLKPGQPIYVRDMIDLGSSVFNWNPVVSWYTIQMNWKLYLANVAMLLPAGMFAKYFIKNPAVRWLSGLSICFGLELLQPVIGTGVFDILSVILAGIGYLLGEAVMHQYGAERGVL